MDDKFYNLLEKIYGEFMGFKQEMSEFKEEMSEFKQETQKNFITLNDKVDQVDNNVLKIENHIENEVAPQINALFDGWKQNSEQLNRIEEQVGRHEEFIIKRIK